MKKQLFATISQRSILLKKDNLLTRVLICLPLAFVVFMVAPVDAQETITITQRTRIDKVVTDVLAITGTPSASIALVRDAQIVYEQGYGSGRLTPPQQATPTMRYCIGSISKQFAATTLLLLAEEKKLSLDDKVAQWLPELTQAKNISLRQLLSMTAGYQDYYPQGYLFVDMLKPTTPQAILDRWARKPLDFLPGTQWQYSNTNYIIAGLIAEKVSGMPLFDFLQKRIFSPLRMTSVIDIGAGALSTDDAEGYTRNALGPLRPALKEAKGWVFAAGELAMTPHDLALWDIATINRTVLQPSSYKVMQTDMHLTNGLATRYGLGVSVNAVNDHWRIFHSGGLSGFVSRNEIYPDDRTAIVVLTNGESAAANQIAQGIATALFDTSNADGSQALRAAQTIFANLQKGKFDRSLFSPNANAYFSEEVLADYTMSLAPLGTPSEFVELNHGSRGGMTIHSFRIKSGSKTLGLTTLSLPNGTLEQYLIQPEG